MVLGTRRSLKHPRIRCLVLVLTVSFALADSSFARKKEKSFLDRVYKTVDAALVQVPKDMEVCFSPVEPCDAKLVKFIDSAVRSIDIAVFDVTLDSFVHHLLVKSKSIPVRIVVDKRQANGAHSLVRTLLKGGAKVRFGKQRGVMHNKFTVVDGRAVETGSFNYTHNASHNNNENQVYLMNPAIVGRFKKRFDEIWGEGIPATLESIAKDGKAE